MRCFKSVFVATVLFFAFSAVSSHAADMKIGVVDLQEILGSSKAGKKIQEELGKKKKELEEKLKKEGVAIEKLIKKLEREAQVMSREQRQEREREIKIKRYDFEMLEKKAKEELLKLQGEKLRVMNKDFHEIVQEIGKKEGYTLIIDKIGGVVYSDKSVDVTDELLKKYDDKY